MSRARLSLVLASAALLGAVSGCNVEPYCLTCDELDGGDMDGSTDGGLRDGTIGRDALPVDALPVDALVPVDGCYPAEICNDLDDDCDGFTDEGIDLERDVRNCGECGNACAPIHAFPVCTAGECRIAECDVGFIDLDMDPATGCEYRCLASATDDRVCDLRDDDCDGDVDEDVAVDTDPVNCGRCGRVCRAPHATGSCTAGTCMLGMCEPGFYDLDESGTNGCEYACTPASPMDEVCNARDDDCDGLTDEGNPGAGVVCGESEGACEPGLTECRGGSVICAGATAATSESCNGLDDDCDAIVDERNPGGGRVCGTSLGACEVGSEVCTDGALVCTGAVGPGVESCNAIDDDCDGRIDEGNPDGGAACGEDEGACEPGMLVCTRGALVCMGGTSPSPELCNGVDDDCDTVIDDGNPESGGLCGSDVGRCAPGIRECRSGALVCVGQTGPVAEVCDGADDDCDGTIDEGNPGGGAACGDGTGECAPGALTCRAGVLACVGTVGPRAERCNMLDDDCDTRTDEGFALSTDVNNCGTCGRVCTLPNALNACMGGNCVVAGCLSGFHDLDPGMPGCEYACSYAGNEACNGRDDDCDGDIDEGLTPPASFCNPNGVCAGTAASCSGAGGWVCNYPMTYDGADARCDSLDNDCDGRVDEAFTLVGTACGNGVGACRRTGAYRCNAAGDGVTCGAAAAGAPASESCNAVDDDCDGLVDEPGVDDPLTAWRDAIDVSAISTVPVTFGGRSFRVMQYEASRPDASSASAGSASTLACSRSGVVPWTSVTQAQAAAACCALNAGGACPGTGMPGWRLCDAADWELACEGPAGSCDYGYASMCTASQPLVCNGMERDSDAALAGDQDAIALTGAFPMCGTSWAGGLVSDLSGNVREWTATQSSPGFFQVRGGSYNSIEAGRACDFSFTVSGSDDAAPNTGFRCCLY